MSKQDVGLIGLGLMGGGIGKNLLRKGFALTVFDVDPAAVVRLGKLGAMAVDSPQALAERSEVIITVVPDSPQVEEALFGPRGALKGARPGTIFVDCSTIDPFASRAIGDRVRAAGCRFVDAGMGGSSKQADEGELLLMVGATPEDFEALQPVLRAIATKVFHCGGPNAGITMKVVNNTLAASIFAADVEALALGRKAGLTAEVMLDVLTHTAADNPALHGQVPNEVLPGKYEPGFKAWMAHKDLGLGQNLAALLGVPLFTLAPARQLYSLALALGKRDRSHSVIAQVLEELLGIRIGQ